MAAFNCKIEKDIEYSKKNNTIFVRTYGQHCRVNAKLMFYVWDKTTCLCPTTTRNRQSFTLNEHLNKLVCGYDEQELEISFSNIKHVPRGTICWICVFGDKCLVSCGVSFVIIIVCRRR